ncbi:hypothetical protein DM860_013136 [Cuscuta australis]|uniref:Uncharacterized protein n=1 Tax=Cuscuta australis TaxID=267555 RepID=A0A328D6X8_9ASTE|nr:hypothetical protein DM860_013136 [Cuscuta australis]
MMIASDVDDAKARASPALEYFLGSKICHPTISLAVSILHDRPKEFDERGKEVNHLKQLLAQYQEQLRTLEVNKCALAVHFKQAQQSNSISGHFNPDVF